MADHMVGCAALQKNAEGIQSGAIWKKLFVKSDHLSVQGLLQLVAPGASAEIIVQLPGHTVFVLP